MFEDNPFSHEDAARAMASFRVAESRRDYLNKKAEVAKHMQKRAADLTFAIPGLMGLGAAGTAGYLGMREARAEGRIRALEKYDNMRDQDIAKEKVDRNAIRKAAPLSALAGAGAGYLLGAHVPEHLIRETADSSGKAIARTNIKDLSLGKKLLYAPGAQVQRGLKALGATSNVGRSIAGVATLGAGLLAGNAIGKNTAEKSKRVKTAGLFMKPSDIAGSHHELSAALEGKLNNSSGGSSFKKHAFSMEGAAIGAAVGTIMEPIRQAKTKPVEAPEPQEPKGFMNKLRHSRQKASYEGDKWARENPLTAMVLAGGAGAVAGGATNLGQGLRNLKDTFTRSPRST